jgi:predicted Kef-type K+ transport protein
MAIGSLPIIFALLNLLSCCYSLAIILMQSRVSAKSFFRSVWAYFDIFYVIINSFISIGFLSNELIAVNNLRKVEAILSIVIVGKLVYYT